MSQFLPVGASPTTVIPIKRPSAYDRFEASSWLDQLQAKIKRELNPPDSPGPSRSPSPIALDAPEDGTQTEEADVLNAPFPPLLNGDQEVEDEDGSEQDEYGDDDGALEANEHQHGVDEESDGIEVLEDSEQEYDDDEEPGEHNEELFGSQQDGDEDQLFESQSQGEYDPAYGVVAEEDNAAYVGSDGDVYDEDDDEEFDEDAADDEEQEEVEDDEEDPAEAQGDSDEDEAEEEEDDDDDEIEYVGTSQSPAPKTTALVSSPAPPSNLYPLLPPPPPPIFAQEAHTDSDDQIAQFPTFADEAIDPSLLAEIVQQVHEAMPEDDGASPSMLTAPLSTQSILQFQEAPQAALYAEDPRQSSEEQADDEGTHLTQASGSASYLKPETGYAAQYAAYDALDRGYDRANNYGDQGEDEDGDEGKFNNLSEAHYDEDELDHESDNGEDDNSNLHPKPVRRPIPSDEVIEIGSSSEEDEDLEDEEGEEDEDDEDDEEVVEEEDEDDNERNKKLQEVEDQYPTVYRSVDEEGLSDLDSNDNEEEEEDQYIGEGGDDDDIVMDEPQEGVQHILVDEDVIVEEVSDQPLQEAESGEADVSDDQPAEEAIMYDGEVIEDRHAPIPDVVFPHSLKASEMDEDEPQETAIEVIEITQTVGNDDEISTRPEPAVDDGIAEVEEPVDSGRTVIEVVEITQTTLESAKTADEDVQPVTTAEEPLPADRPAEQELVEPEVTDSFTVDVEDSMIDKSEEPTPSPIQRPAHLQTEGVFNDEDYISFDTPEPNEEEITAQTRAQDSLVEDSTTDSDLVDRTEGISAAQMEGARSRSEDPVDTMPNPQTSFSSEIVTAMPDVPRQVQLTSDVSTSPATETPTLPTPADLVSPSDISERDTPPSFPDSSARAPETDVAMPVVPLTIVDADRRSPSVVAEHAEHDPLPEDVTEAVSQAEIPVSFPDPSLPPPNTSAAQPLDIHNIVPKANDTPSLVVEIAQDPVPADIASAGPSRPPSPPILPNPRLAAPDTSTENPLNLLDFEPRPQRSPSLMVEPPEVDPVPGDIVSTVVSRAASPVNMPDPSLPPPDAYLEAPLTPHRLSPSSEPQTPSLEVEPPADTPTAAVFSRLPSTMGSTVDTADVEMSDQNDDEDVQGDGDDNRNDDKDNNNDDDDIQIDVRQISPPPRELDTQSRSEEGEQQAQDDDAPEEGEQRAHDDASEGVQASRESTPGQEETFDPFSALNDPDDDEDISVEVHQVEPGQSFRNASEEAEPAPEEMDREEGTTAGRGSEEVPLSDAQNSSADLEEEPQTDDTVAQGPQRSGSATPVGSSSQFESQSDAASEPAVHDTSEPASVDDGAESIQSDEEKTEAGSPVKESSAVLPPPLPHMTSSAIMRLRHIHGNAPDQPPAVEPAPTHRRTRSKAQASASPAPPPPVTRSHCYYEKLRVSDDDLTAVIMVPHCTVSDLEQLEEETSQVEGEASDMEELEARTQQMDHSNPILHPRLTTKIRRIIGAQIFDEGHCYLLYAADDAKLPPADEFGTPKSTASGKHRSRKSLSAVPPRFTVEEDDRTDRTDSGDVNTVSTPVKRGRTASPARRRSLPKEQAAAATVEPEEDIIVTPVRRGGSVKPVGARKGKGRESSILSDTGSVVSTAASPGPGLRRSARVSAARGEGIPEETLPVPDTVKEEEESDVYAVDPSPTPEPGNSLNKATPLRRSGRRSVPPKLYTPSPEPMAQADDVKAQVNTPAKDTSATPSKLTPRGQARKSLTLASKKDDAPYRPASDDEEEEEDEAGQDEDAGGESDSAIRPPVSAHSTLSVEIPMRKRKSRASDIAKDDGSPGTQSDGGDTVAEGSDDEDPGEKGETRENKRRAVESRLVPGTPVPEPQMDTADEDVEITMESSDSPIESTAQSGLTRSQSWGGRILSRFGWGRR
ncbi:hypothetical protein I317_01170 [Kwoniella heveanensis CBS 569]|nr:hypothetical protein I317_01170 [Kwoniella heveanensis CBS 569]